MAGEVGRYVNSMFSFIALVTKVSTEKCREAQLHPPVFQIMSDRRGMLGLLCPVIDKLN